LHEEELALFARSHARRALQPGLLGLIEAHAPLIRATHSVVDEISIVIAPVGGGGGGGGGGTVVLTSTSRPSM